MGFLDSGHLKKTYSFKLYTLSFWFTLLWSTDAFLFFRRVCFYCCFTCHALKSPWVIAIIFKYLGDNKFSSAAQSCPILSDPVDCSIPDFPIHHQFPELAQTHVHRVGDTIQPSHPLSSPSPPSCLQSFPASGCFPLSQFFASGGQSIRVSASVLPMNIQDWFPLGLTGLITLQSKELSRMD